MFNDNYAGNKTLKLEMLNNDLSKMNANEKCDYIYNVCESLGLNPLTHPIQVLRLQGKEKMYMTKDGTEQLRKLHGISVTELKCETINETYIVKAFVSSKDGRQDISTGAVSLKSKSGDDLANAIMKAESKAKRRATLSICGLGMLDESEIETIKDAKIIERFDPEPFLALIDDCKTLDELKLVYIAYQKQFKDKGCTNDDLKKLVQKKDEVKERINSELLMTNDIPLGIKENNHLINIDDDLPDDVKEHLVGMTKTLKVNL